MRFFRQRNRVIGAAGQPIVFWLLFGAGLQRTFRLGSGDSSGESFLQYFYPGVLVLMVLFTAIFATISIIEDRKEGFLQSVLAAPAPRWSMVLGKVLGGALIAMVQALIFLLLALTIDVKLTVTSTAALIALVFVAAVALTSLGFVIAWRMDSTQGFHAVMNLLLMPLWLLSGAFFPVPESGGEWSQTALHWVMRANPVTYCVAGARRLLGGAPPPEEFWTPSLAACWTVSLIFAAVMFAAACRIAARGTKGDLL